VYLVQCQDENLAKLTDIQRGKDATESLLARYSRRPADFQEDLSSKAAIDAYYQTLYREMPEGFQDDPVRGKPYSIFSLLADNSCFADERAESFGSYFLNQAFRLAGRLFQVYDDDHLDVIVPYESGKEVIAALALNRRKETWNTGKHGWKRPSPIPFPCTTTSGGGWKRSTAFGRSETVIPAHGRFQKAFTRKRLGFP